VPQNLSLSDVRGIYTRCIGIKLGNSNSNRRATSFFFCTRQINHTAPKLRSLGLTRQSHLAADIIARNIGLEGSVKAEEQQKDGHAQSKDVRVRAAPQLFGELRWLDHLRRHEAVTHENGWERVRL